MPFNSFNFWLIFPFIFALYWMIPARWLRARNGFLLIVSYLLYINWKPAFAVVLLGVTVVTYFGASCVQRGQMEKSDQEDQDGGMEKMSQKWAGNRRRLCFIFGLLGLLPLLAFKYYNFLNDNITTGLEMCGLHFALPGLHWAMPVGISFFTFQAVGYLLDVYKRRIEAERNFLDYALFVSFFPQVASGPISTAKDLMPQLKTARSFSYGQGVVGLKMLLWGMFLKCVIADRLGLYVDMVFLHYLFFSGLNCYLACLFNIFQIYCDFAGYSLMATGIARTLGIDLIDNFRRPFLAASVTELWRRWHISLTRWLTTHVYYSLGGNRCTKLRQYFNIMVTFLVCALWHGASWTFVVWGALQGLFQIVERFLLGNKLKEELRHGYCGSLQMRLFRILLTIHLFCFSMIFFRMPSLQHAWNIVVRICTDHTCQSVLYKAEHRDILFIAVGILSLVCVEIRQEFLPHRLRWLDSKWCRYVLYLITFCMILCIGVLDSSSFIYVSF